MASMDLPRDIQTFRRNERARATVSSCSSLGMEIKRKKIRQSTVFLPNEDSNIQEKIDFEIRMREGAYKLLVASTKREQILNASKSLLTCNTRIKGYITELQKRKEDQDAKVTSMRRLFGYLPQKDFSVSVKLRVLRVEFQPMATEARPQFELTLELYSCAMEEDASLVNTPKKLARRLRNSLGKASGKKLCPLLEAGDPESFLQSNPISPYHLLAYTTLCLAQAEGSFQSHSLIVVQNAESSSWLPLYGNLCCRLVAQPDCMTQDMISGYLNQQGCGPQSSSCRLDGPSGSLSCYYSPEEIHAKIEPALVIPINKETRIRVVDKDQRKGSHSLTIINPVAGEAGVTQVFTAESREELEAWMEAFWQHFYDQVEWQHCCSELMKIEAPSPRKPPLFQTRHADSVYNDLSECFTSPMLVYEQLMVECSFMNHIMGGATLSCIGSPGKFESLTDIIHNKIEETGGRFLIGQEEETEAPDWAALFGGSRPLVVQKNVVSPSRRNTHPSPNVTKKRRAPPPPPDKQPYSSASNSTPYVPADYSASYVLANSAPYTPGPSSAHHQEKENRKKPGTRTGRPSLDAKFSAIIQQLQKNPGLAQKCASVRMQDAENQPPDLPQKPVPAPRHKRKSFREKINPKAW
ncbi:hypothetical protein JZ751_018535 [Albula glossodonta]|uniref:REM-1 domain-containing protein n=1 Tax=Albula glossodonta TaxID=121402 RepID=A0A8T2NLY8_9TELE|nr:hypothetical protein JZ751_018535 [Albula glossodonta]